MHAYINQPANVLLFSHIRKFLCDFMRFFCIIRQFFVPLQRETTNYGQWECDAG